MISSFLSYRSLKICRHCGEQLSTAILFYQSEFVNTFFPLPFVPEGFFARLVPICAVFSRFISKYGIFFGYFFIKIIFFSCNLIHSILY